mgnify:CR=1 FL=1|tara:strand:+ start:2429 stop:4189 length:1761 start_codon:yes stop_codon:yes gene_type:complete
MIHFDQLIPSNGYVIGELACGHEGDISKCQKLIDCVASSGASIVKFQIFIPSERATEDHPEWKIFNDLALTRQEWLQASQYARAKNLTIFADVFGEAGFSIAQEIGVDGYKIHSEDLHNIHFIAKVAADNKLLLIGVGGAHRIEIYNLIRFLKAKDVCRQIVLMPGVQTFPTPLEAHSIEEVGDLHAIYASQGIKVGFSDHISGDCEEALIAPLMALAHGACILEKHITIDRDDQWEDYQSALGRENFARFVHYVNRVSPLLRKTGNFNDFESEYRHIFKKTPVVSRTLQAGHILELGDIHYAKHADSKVPLSSTQLLNKTLRTAVSQYGPLRPTNVNNVVGGIIVVRCMSNRFPNKAIKTIQNREAISLLIERIQRCTTLDQIVLATTSDSSDDVLVDIAERHKISSFRGSRDNLSSRFYGAAKHFGLDHIVRITGDDLLRDEIMIDRAVESHLHHGCDVTFMHNMPYGTSSDVFSLNVIETIFNTARVPKNTEYLEYYLENDRYFSMNTIRSDYQFSPDLRMSLDYEEDLQFFCRVFDQFYPCNPTFTVADTLQWIQENPSVININKHKPVKLTRNDIDVSLNI